MRYKQLFLICFISGLLSAPGQTEPLPQNPNDSKEALCQAKILLEGKPLLGPYKNISSATKDLEILELCSLPEKAEENTLSTPTDKVIVYNLLCLEGVDDNPGYLVAYKKGDGELFFYDDPDFQNSFNSSGSVEFKLEKQRIIEPVLTLIEYTTEEIFPDGSQENSQSSLLIGPLKSGKWGFLLVDGKIDKIDKFTKCK